MNATDGENSRPRRFDMEIARRIFESQQQRRFGVFNPERMKLVFWEWMASGSEDVRLRESSDEHEPPASGPTPYPRTSGKASRPTQGFRAPWRFIGEAKST
jgi:hypothetical protein